jgi:integrase
MALVNFLLKTDTRHVVFDDTKIGDWVKKFTASEDNPRAARNNAQNTPYSADTLDGYKTYYNCHIKDDPLMRLKMSDVTEEDALAFINRMAEKKIRGGREMAGTRTFAGLMKFVRMAFHEYWKTHRGWANPFAYIDPPKRAQKTSRGSLTENEVASLFSPDVLRDTMERAVCAAMFLAGLRRSEIFALRPEDLDWKASEIIVRQAWQNFDRPCRKLGPPKGKKEREAPFHAILQNAIARLWEERGRHEFVFCWKNGKTPNAYWIKEHFKKWLARAGIDLAGRNITPHSSRHSLASLLEARGAPLRYIQDLLGHCDLKTTKSYLHTGEDALRGLGEHIGAAMTPDASRRVSARRTIRRRITSRSRKKNKKTFGSSKHVNARTNRAIAHE